MADLTVNSKVSVDAYATMRGEVFSNGLVAGEALSKGDAVFLHTDGKLYQSDAADHIDSLTLEAGATDPVLQTSKFIGFVIEDYAAGDVVSVFGKGCVITNYATGMTPSASYWVSGTQGKLSDARISTNDSAVAMALSATDIRVLR